MQLGDLLDEAIRDIFHHTPCPCTQQQCAENDSGYRIGIALVREMDLGGDSQVHSADVSRLALHSLSLVDYLDLTKK